MLHQAPHAFSHTCGKFLFPCVQFPDHCNQCHSHCKFSSVSNSLPSFINITQTFNHFIVSLFNGNVEWCLASFVCQIFISLSCKQLFNHFHMSILCSNEKWCSAIITGRVDISMCGQQDLHHSCM